MEFHIHLLTFQDGCLLCFLNSRSRLDKKHSATAEVKALHSLAELLENQQKAKVSNVINSFIHTESSVADLQSQMSGWFSDS